MDRKNNSVEKGFMEKTIEKSSAMMLFDREEIAIIRDLAGNSKDALRVVNDIILAHNNEKGFVVDVLEELLKNDVRGNSLVTLYDNCDRDVELLIWNVERGKLEMKREDYL
ncbi:hypothetical protein M1567_01310 [Candidatus Marsarchaeota archaeon]|nr:hypothetical protein [Candidatus Marsarchaeota archaeon]